jgi:membrane-bound lytic murein transglycosylase D
MSIKNPTIFLLLFTLSLFSQEISKSNEITKMVTKTTYLDSIKKTFVKDQMAECVDSLWMKELTNLDLYTDLSDDIKNINIDTKVDYELPTELLKARLKAMDAKSPFNIEYNPGLENLIKSFLKNRKKSFERLMAISEYYFPLFEEALAKQNVPLEIKYLAVVESALNPKAVSRMGATGLWQFMYQTGKQYNLKIDSYVDDRSDPLKSSAAATQYMTNMYAIFGDWDLVLASYNSGPGNVAKAIRRSGGQQNYWNIRKHLPKETQGYVPAFLATMYIYEYHTAHGIVPNRAAIKHFATDTIMIKKQMSFKQVSDLLDIPVAQLQLLNPSYKLNVIPFYEDQSHFLRLPQDKVAAFTSNEDKIYAYLEHEGNLRERPFQITNAVVANDTINATNERVTLSKTKYYTVRRGDNLSAIANKYDVTIQDLKSWNNLRNNTVSRGRSLKIISNESVVRNIKAEPKAIKTTLESTVENAVTTAVKPSIVDSVTTSSSALYVVQKGDNLSNIAKKYNVTTQELKDWNKLSNGNIQLGATLQIAKNTETSKAELTEKPILEDIKYVVQKGDNLGIIAKKFGALVVDLKQWNNLSDNTISIGNSLIVAKNQPAIIAKTAENTFNKKEKLAATSKAKSSNYYVKKGDSLFSIAKKYPGVTISDLKKWNDIRGEEIKPGMKLKING